MSTASELMDGEHRRPDHARVRAPARELDGGPLPERRKRPARRLGAGRVEEQLGGAREAPAEHQPLRLERVDDGRDADAEPAPIALEEGARLAVALACRLDRIAARATALLRDEPADRALRVALAAARRLALEAAAAAVPLERAGARQLVHRIRLLPGGAAIDHDVAQLGAETGGAAEDPPVDDQYAADAGAERQHRELARGRIGDQLRLAERSAVGVVVDEDRHSQAVAQGRAQRNARQRDVHARECGAALGVDLGGHADPDRRQAPVETCGRLARNRRDLVEQRLLAGPVGRPLDPAPDLDAVDDRTGDLRAADVDADHRAGQAASPSTSRAAPSAPPRSPSSATWTAGGESSSKRCGSIAAAIRSL